MKINLVSINILHLRKYLFELIKSLLKQFKGEELKYTPNIDQKNVGSSPENFPSKSLLCTLQIPLHKIIFFLKTTPSRR
jgi:hypothetical protein